MTWKHSCRDYGTMQRIHMETGSTRTVTVPMVSIRMAMGMRASHPPGMIVMIRTQRYTPMRSILLETESTRIAIVPTALMKTTMVPRVSVQEEQIATTRTPWFDQEHQKNATLLTITAMGSWTMRLTPTETDSTSAKTATT